MKDYIKENIEAFGETIKRGAPTPAETDLSSTDEESDTLDSNKEEVFKHIVTKFLYVAKKYRLGVHLTNGHIRTILSKCTEQDLDKLRQLLQYLYKTMDEFLTIKVEKLSIISF